MVSVRVFCFVLVLLFLIVERLLELRSANRNFLQLLANGGKEFGSRHYRAIVLMHTAFFFSLVLEFTLRRAPVASFWAFSVALLLLAQTLRLWSRRTMGERWTTRIVAVPNERLLTNGPFRFLRHPIYIAVAMELFSVPLMFGLYFTCAFFTLLNALLLFVVRIPEEEQALAWGQNSTMEAGTSELPGQDFVS